MPATAPDLVVLKSALFRWEIVEYMATATVILGVVGEYVADFTEFAEQRKIEKKIGKLSTLVLIVGLSMELFALVRTSTLSGELIASLEEQSARGSADAESAKSMAKGFESHIADANARAKAAEALVATASADSRDAVTKVASAQARIAEAEARAAQANQKAEEERLARVKIEQRIAPRQLTNAQRAAFVEALKRSAVKGTVSLACVLGDGEGFAFANQLDDALKAAGWPTTGVSQGAYGPGGNPIGFAIVVHSAASTPPYAAILQRAFKIAGIEVAGIENSNIVEGQVHLVIGNKPQ